MFEHFADHELETERGVIFARVGGSGPPLLLLHGYPQTHLMWHAVAPRLAERFTVVAADLAGYGASFRPAPAADHAPHSKRALAADQVQAMAALGHERFAVAGHDRGGRVAYRMALDHPERISAVAVFDVVPTGEVWARADAQLALVYWHWAFLAQPAPLPERLIAGDPDAFFDLHVRALGLGRQPDRYPPELMAAYRRLLDDPSVVEAICEDYRAGATIDREHDDADRGKRRIECPLLGAVERPRRAAAPVRRRARGVAAVGARGDRTRARRQPLPRRGPPRGRRPRADRLPSRPRPHPSRRLTHGVRHHRRAAAARRPRRPASSAPSSSTCTSSIPGREIVQVLTEIPAGVESGWHQHPGEEVGYIVAGTVRMEIEGRDTLTLEAGDGLPDPAAHAAQRARPRARDRTDALDLHRRDR